MPILFFLAPKLLIIGSLMLAGTWLVRRYLAEGAAEIAFRRLGRMAAVLTVAGAIPLAVVVMQGASAPGGFQDALASHTFDSMGSTILR